jgi:26S proteasome regulatory subunit (ATPase 3-interacting protein)
MEDSFDSEFKLSAKKIKLNPKKSRKGSSVKKATGDNEEEDLFKGIDELYNEIQEVPNSSSSLRNNTVAKDQLEDGKRARRSVAGSKSPLPEKDKPESKVGGRGRKPKVKKEEGKQLIEEKVTEAPRAQTTDKSANIKGNNKQKIVEEKVEEPIKAKKGGNAPVSKEGSVEENVHDYLRKMNRPYSIINIFDNLHGKIKKPDLQKVLDNLVKDKKIIEKEFGKCLVYWYNQALIEVNQDRLEDEKEKYTSAKERHDQLRKSLQELKAKLAVLEKVPTTESYKEQIKKCDQEIPILEDKLARYKNKSEPMVSPELIHDLEFKLSDFEKLRAKRKKIFTNIIDSLLESTGLARKKLFEKIGLE